MTPTSSFVCVFLHSFSSYFPHSLPHFSWVTGVGFRGSVKAVTRESGWQMMGHSWPFSLSLPICGDTARTLAHVVALTSPRCQLFSLSSSSCYSTRLMRFSLANITTHHYCVAFPFRPDRNTLIKKPKQCRDIILATKKFAMTHRMDVVQESS